MNKKEFIIGAKNKPNLVITISTWEYKNCYISRYEKDRGYIVTINKFNTRIYIINGCAEFHTLRNLLSKDDKNEKIYNFITILAIRCLSAVEIFDIIKNIEDESFNNGYKKAQDDMKKVLGL